MMLVQNVNIKIIFSYLKIHTWRLQIAISHFLSIFHLHKKKTTAFQEMNKLHCAIVKMFVHTDSRLTEDGIRPVVPFILAHKYLVFVSISNTCLPEQLKFCMLHCVKGVSWMDQT